MRPVLVLGLLLSSLSLLSTALLGEAGLAMGILANFFPDAQVDFGDVFAFVPLGPGVEEDSLAEVDSLAPMTLAPTGFPLGWVTSLAFMITFWFGPSGPSVPSLTATPKDWPLLLCRGMK